MCVYLEHIRKQLSYSVLFNLNITVAISNNSRENGIKWYFTRKKSISQLEASLQTKFDHIKMKFCAIFAVCLAIFMAIAAAQGGPEIPAVSSTDECESICSGSDIPGSPTSKTTKTDCSSKPIVCNCPFRPAVPST